MTPSAIMPALISTRCCYRPSTPLAHSEALCSIYRWHVGVMTVSWVSYLAWTFWLYDVVMCVGGGVIGGASAPSRIQWVFSDVWVGRREAEQMELRSTVLYFMQYLL